MKQEPEKFYFVEVDRKPVSAEEVRKHLVEFGKAFIDRNRQQRWTHVTEERPEKFKDEIGKLIWEANDEYVTTMGSSSAFPDSLARQFGDSLGIFFNGIDEPCKVTPVEASSLAAETPQDALFLIKPGGLALFFFHEGDVLMLKKDGAR